MCVALLWSAAAAADHGGSHVEMRRAEDGAIELEGVFSTTAPASLVWEALTDYENLDEFVSFLGKSQVEERGDGRVLLRQTVVGRFWLFWRSVNLLLRVEERPPDELRFEDTLKRDFDIYRGYWTLRPEDGDSTTVRYHLRARRTFAAPDAIARNVFHDNVEEYLEQVRLEVLKRAAAGAS